MTEGWPVPVLGQQPSTWRFISRPPSFDHFSHAPAIDNTPLCPSRPSVVADPANYAPPANASFHTRSDDGTWRASYLAFGCPHRASLARDHRYNIEERCTDPPSTYHPENLPKVRTPEHRHQRPIAIRLWFRPAISSLGGNQTQLLQERVAGQKPSGFQGFGTHAQARPSL